MADTHSRPPLFEDEPPTDRPLPKPIEPMPRQTLPPKPKLHGGKREGAGRKPTLGATPKVIYSVRVPPEIKAGLIHLGAEWLEQAVIEALRIEQERKL